MSRWSGEGDSVPPASSPGQLPSYHQMAPILPAWSPQKELPLITHRPQTCGSRWPACHGASALQVYEGAVGPSLHLCLCSAGLVSVLCLVVPRSFVSPNDMSENTGLFCYSPVKSFPRSGHWGARLPPSSSFWCLGLCWMGRPSQSAPICHVSFFWGYRLLSVGFS